MSAYKCVMILHYIKFQCFLNSFDHFNNNFIKSCPPPISYNMDWISALHGNKQFVSHLGYSMHPDADTQRCKTGARKLMLTFANFCYQSFP